MHNFILGLRFNELFRNETRYLFFYLFYSPLELDWNRKNCSNAEQKSHCRAHNYQRALVYNFGRKCKASFGSNYHKDHNTQGWRDEVHFLALFEEFKALMPLYDIAFTSTTFFRFWLISFSIRTRSHTLTSVISCPRLFFFIFYCAFPFYIF